MITLRGSSLYDDKGKFLKEMYCPDDDAKAALASGKTALLDCKTCSKIVHNTDYLSEDQIKQLIAEDPDVCLRINRVNPIFESVEDC